MCLFLENYCSYKKHKYGGRSGILQTCDGSATTNTSAHSFTRRMVGNAAPRTHTAFVATSNHTSHMQSISIIYYMPSFIFMARKIFVQPPIRINVATAA